MGEGIRYIGWSGRGWPDGGPVSAGPISSRAPSWERCGWEIGINMVRMGFTMKHFTPEYPDEGFSFPQYIKKGMENTDVSWAKSKHTSYSYCLERCREMGWEILICVNPSLKSRWHPYLITKSSDALKLWQQFCYHLAGYIDEKWPGEARFFEITNEPDIGYFDGESFIPGYKGIRGGITPKQYKLLLNEASRGIKRVVPEAKVIGPGLAEWNRKWVRRILNQNSSLLDGLSYHNVSGNLEDDRILEKARILFRDYISLSSDIIFNSEWAWWPHHDTDELETALRVAQILYFQAEGGAYGSLYLGPAQPKGFKKGLGVLKFDPFEPDSIEKTKTFYAFRLMVRGILGGKRLEVVNPFKKLKVLAVCKNNQELIITVLNPANKIFPSLSIQIHDSFKLKKDAFLKVYRFTHYHVGYSHDCNYNVLNNFKFEPKSISQFSVPIEMGNK